MRLFNFKILSIALLFGLSLGLVDSIFDYRYHYLGTATFTRFLVTELPLYEILWRAFFLASSLLLGLLISYMYNKRKASESLLQNVFNNIIPICITDNNYDILMANKSYYSIFGMPRKPAEVMKCYDSRPGLKCRTEGCPVDVIRDGGEEVYMCESTKSEPNKPTRTFIVTATPYRNQDDKQIGIIECFQDITPRKLLEKEKEQLIGSLNNALKEVKKLSGFLPICASCKKIRDDQGYWKQVESYIAEHSEAEFSHSICPDCMKRHYPKFTPSS